MNHIQTINNLLPQTQCRECGFSGCLPYAQALSSGQAAINLCLPGGAVVMHDLANLLQIPPQTAPVHQNVLAWIDEAVCIGCTACIRACPVDAIMGASKLMHTVLADECTGCGLCVAPCPVDCIHMQPVSDSHLPRARYLSEQNEPRFAAAGHALARYEQRNRRKQQQNEQRKQHLAQAQAAFRQPETAAQPAKTALNPAALIAQAKARAQEQQSNRSVPANRSNFREQQIKEAQEKAEYRRNMHNAQYGSDTEKAAAIEWLRRHKAEQEAKAAAKLS